MYLVTGGAGFIGSHIVEELLRKGERVRVLDNFSTGKRENLNFGRNLKPAVKDRDFPDAVQLEIIEGDLRDLDTVHKAVKGVDYVLHQGTLPSVTRSLVDPITTTQVNILGTLNILIASRDVGVRKVVYACSSSVYGDTEILPKMETMTPNPLSPYAVSKLAGENYCRVFYKNFGLEAVSLRYFNVFGPRQDPESEYAAAIPKFITTMLKEERPTIYGDGKQSRDFTFVANVVEANLLACPIPKLGGEILNIACGKKFNLLDLVKKINQILGTSIEPKHSEPRMGEVRHSQADISKAKRIINYQPRINFEDGLKKTIETFKER